jgi:O-antigen ligase
MPLVTLVILASALGYSVWQSGGVERADWNFSLVLIGASALLYWSSVRRNDRAAALEPVLRWPLILLPAYVLLQLVPLPVAWLEILSPARAQLAAAASRVLPPAAFAPLSVAPAATFEHLLRVCAYVTTFLLVREIAWRLDELRWVAILPLPVIAAAEAVLGITQSGGAGFARGTYVNRNHFAGFLELALPFALAGSLALARGRRGKPLSIRLALMACLGLGVAALIFIAALDSLSRMGFLACLTGLLVVGVLEIPTRRRLWLGGALVLAVAAALIWLPSDALSERLKSLSAPGEISSVTRLAVWTDTLRLIRSYPVFGCGLGAYQSAFYGFQTEAPLNTVDHAHNDYLQLVAELGLAGVLIVAAGLLALLYITVRAFRKADSVARYVSISSLAALAAILLHSLVDFNLYIPANALAVAWIAGMAVSGKSGPPAPDRFPNVARVPKVVEVRAIR